MARFEIPLGEGQSPDQQIFLDIALSPDGSRIVYAGDGPNGEPQLWQRLLVDLEPTPVPGTERGFHPSVSPDGMSISFTADGGIKTALLGGSPPQTVVVRGGASNWGPDDMIYFVVDGVIHRVSPEGGEAEAFTSPSDSPQRLGQALPDGRGYLLTIVATDPIDSRIAVVGGEGGEVREILTGTAALYANSGHLVYTTADGILRAAPFDLNLLDVTGDAVALEEGIEITSTSISQFALSETGTLIYLPSVESKAEMVWVDRDGGVQPVDPSWTGDFAAPALSPDDERLAVAITGAGPTDIWTKQLDRGASLKVTSGESLNDYPTWTPEGDSLIYWSGIGEAIDLFTSGAEGGGRVLLLDKDRGVAEGLWSSDRAWLVYRTSFVSVGSGDILAQPADGGSDPVELAVTTDAERTPTLSPDDRWLAYSSNESGPYEIYVVSLPEGTGKRTVSIGGGTEPVWSRSGGEIFYRRGDGQMVAVAVETEPTFSVGQTTELFQADGFRSNVSHPQYDVTRDGQRFMMIRDLEDEANKLIIVLNFFDELKRRVGN